MKTLLLLLVAWLSSSAMAAGSASAIIGGGAYKLPAGTYSVKGATATAANGAFNTPATVTAAGKSVTMPATATIAANAASFAISAIRVNPAGLMLSLTASWLLGKGLTYAGDHWNKGVPAGTVVPAVSWLPYQEVAGYCAGLTSERACADKKFVSVYGAITGAVTGPVYQAGYGNRYSYAQGGNIYVMPTCGAGTTFSNGQCLTQASGTTLATEADFTAAAVDPLPSNVAQELARADVPIPVNDPVLAPAPVIENYGSPFVDPVTGKTVQTKTRITPDPSPTDPFRVRIESYNVEVAPAPAPLPGDPVIVPEAEQPSDPCIDNPDRFGCLDAGTPEDVDLATHTPTFTVTPVSIGGAGNCPPNPTFTAAGRSFTINYGPMCDAATWLKPLVLAMAWLSAALIVAGAVRES